MFLTKPPCPLSTLPQILTWPLLLLLATLGHPFMDSAVAAEGRPVRLVFRGIECYQETDEVGADEPYVYIFAANVRTGESYSSGLAFQDVDEDEKHNANVEAGQWPSVLTANELVVVMAMFEDDAKGIYPKGPKPAELSFTITDVRQLQKHLDPDLKKIVNEWKAKYYPAPAFRHLVVQQLLKRMPKESTSIHYDDCLGSVALNVKTEDLVGRTVKRDAAVLGDGGAYKIFFDVHSGPAFYKPGSPSKGQAVGGPTPQLVGAWRSNLGPVNLQQDGGQVTGTVDFPNGVRGRVSGTIDGTLLRCKWRVFDNHYGEARLQIAADGKTLEGTYHSSVDPNFKGPWKLTREGSPPGSASPQLPNMLALSGAWDSNLGEVKLVQKAATVSGTVNFPNGVVGTVSANIDGIQLKCKWRVSDMHYGDALLKVLPGGDRLEGTYQSSLDPNFKGSWHLTRKAPDSRPSDAIPPGLVWLGGKWESNLGRVDLQQHGNGINGTVAFPNGVAGKFRGVVKGDRLSGNWFVFENHHGVAELKVSSAGNQMTGTYRSSVDPNFKGEWVLRRQ